MPTRKNVTKITCGLVCLALSVLAHADGITLVLDSNWSDYALYSYTDTSGVLQSNIPVGPYMATLNGDGYNNTPVLLFCYDMNADTNVGTPFTGTEEPVTTFSDPSYTEILKSTYLINELADDGAINAPLATRGAISLAIWEIMNPSSTTSSTPFPTDPAAIPYENEAAAAVASGAWTAADADQFPTWMPDDTLIQRFGTESRTPEPATFVMTGLGLLGLGLVAGRSRALSLIIVRK
jgi:hypothetical protein